MTPARTLRSQRRRGFTVVELLVAMTVLVVVLGVGSVFFARQAQLQRAVQARNDVQDRLRVAMQLVTQDLSLAGAPLRLLADGTIDRDAPQHDCFEFSEEFGFSVYSCVGLVSADDTRSSIQVRYMTSQFESARSCRDVEYTLRSDDDGLTLLRSDVDCGEAPQPVPLASNLLGFKAVVLCSSGVRFDALPDDDCKAPSSYVRSAIVSIGGFSTIPTGTAPAAIEFVSTGGTPGTEACPDGRVCYAMTQEILMPNLKDR
jgi:prepilin-type N-terminal cleavage/methylation domain-containing protein